MKDTDPNVNSKKSNSDEELVEVGEQVPLVGEDGGEEAVEDEEEGGDGDCREEREKTSADRTNSHSEAKSTKSYMVHNICCKMIKPKLQRLNY